MAILKHVEAKIEQVERFKVDFLQNGVNVNGTKENIPQYDYAIAAPGDWTVAEWILKRFQISYPGYEVRVYGANGLPVTNRNIKLANIRR